ncbi:MAG TPA: hypothetical protein VMV77_11850 [Bacteroidales bacterium]|nr:hypothetical protein [Bacteroidales bacterium]
MVSKYYVSKRPQTNDYHAVHQEGCPFLSDEKSSISLGFLSSGREAVVEGQKYFTKTSCCRFCMKEQHAEERQPCFPGIDIESIFSNENQISLALRGALLCFQN